MGSRPELKVDDEIGFIRFYKSISSNDDETIRIFNRNDYYTAHGDDATFIARTVYKTTSVIRQLGRDPGLPSVTLSVTVFRNFIREALLKLGKRVEIYESAGRNTWKVAKTASPGNLQDVEDDLGPNVESAPIILAVKISAKASEARNVGICFADASVRELGVTEFVDNDIYSNFESLLIQLGVRECLITSDHSKKDSDLAKLRSIADNCGCAIAERPMADFSNKDIEQDLSRILKDEKSTSMLPQTDLKLAMSSAAALLKYLGVMSDPSNYGQYSLYQHDLTQYMKLDASALKALNLMPGPRDGSKTMNLFGLLNHCKTPTGSRLLAQWLKQPLMNKEDIERRQMLVEAFYNDTTLRQNMQEEHLRSIPDLYRMAKKFQRRKADLQDVVRAYQAVIRIPDFIKSLEAVQEEPYKSALSLEYTNKFKSFSSSLSKLQEMVETTVDLDAIDRHEYIIKPEFDESLRIIKKKLDGLKSAMIKEHKAVSEDLDQEMDKKLFLEQHRVHGHCFRLTRTEAGCIRNKKKYQECSTQKNGVYFTTSALLEMRREHDQLSETYNRTQSGLVHEVVGVAATYTPVLEAYAACISHLDVIISFAHVSVHAPTAYVRPTIHPRGTGNTILTEARHPCLEVQDDVSFITNDVSLVRGDSEFLIITGPNMGGKSTYIRQIGVIALMAQVGCFVPCTTAEITIFDCILARVGASDSQLKGVSTFMAEMLEAANILKAATRESLIIIDELGRGTSTYDGFGLAWAISEYIVSTIGAVGLFATHFHELTALNKTYRQVTNLHVVAHVETRSSNTTTTDGKEPDGDDVKGDNRQVTLLYKVEPGVSDQSFGIHVAELVRFPDKVVRMAKRKAEELEDFSSAADQENVMQIDDINKGEMEKGQMALKRVLKEWKGKVESSEDIKQDKKKQVRMMKDMVLNDEELKGSRFLKQVMAL